MYVIIVLLFVIYNTSFCITIELKGPFLFKDQGDTSNDYPRLDGREWFEEKK